MPADGASVRLRRCRRRAHARKSAGDREAARPILLNGIEDVISRPDLADRQSFSRYPQDQGRRRPEAELWRQFEMARPRILGALLDAAAHGLRSLSGFDRRPRKATSNGRLLWA